MAVFNYNIRRITPFGATMTISRDTANAASTLTIKMNDSGADWETSFTGPPIIQRDNLHPSDRIQIAQNTAQVAVEIINTDTNISNFVFLQPAATRSFSGTIEEMARGEIKRKALADVASIPDLRRFFRPKEITVLGDSFRIPMKNLLISPVIAPPYTNQNFFFVELKYTKLSEPEGSQRKKRFQILKQKHQHILFSEESLYGGSGLSPELVSDHRLFYRQTSVTTGQPEDLFISAFTPNFYTDEALIILIKQLLDHPRHLERSEEDRKGLIKELLMNLPGAPAATNVVQWTNQNWESLLS